MKKQAMFLVLIIAAIAANAQSGNGFRLTIRMPDVPDSMVYLVHYYGKNRPHIFLRDSARFDKNGIAKFSNNDPDFVGGIYIILLKDTAQTNFELLLNKGDDMTVTTRRSTLPEGIQFKGSPENDRFLQYMKFLKGYANEQQELETQFKNAKTKADTATVREKAKAVAKARVKYTNDYAATYPKTLLAAIFNGMEVPEIPERQHYLEDGKTKDSTYAYRYYKTHYWEKFDFQDDRLIFTPIFDSKLEEYISKLTVPATDSMEKECNMLLAKTKGTKDMFHYTLWWLTRYVENSKVMGMDEVFVYLVENYYMKGDAFWLTSEELAKYIDRARAIAPNVIGNIAPEVKVANVINKKAEAMHALKSRYTLLVFYSPSCGHCDHEIPLIDSVYEAVLKDKGVRVFTVATEGEEKAVTNFLTKNKIDKKWTNTWDPERKSDCRNKYDVYSTPTIYLMDEKKIIRGKRLDHSNIAGLIEMLEKKQIPKS